LNVEINNVRLLPIQPEPHARQASLQYANQALRVGARDDEHVIAVPNQLPVPGACLLRQTLDAPISIEHMEKHIREQRRNHTTLRNSPRRSNFPTIGFDNPRIQPTSNQSKHGTIRYLARQYGHQPAVINRVKVALYVHLNGPAAPVADHPNPLHGIGRTTLRPIPIGDGFESRFENRLQDQFCCSLDDSVAHDGYAKRPPPTIRLRNINTPDSFWTVTPAL
jgi:hypothetical protein